MKFIQVPIAWIERYPIIFLGGWAFWLKGGGEPHSESGLVRVISSEPDRTELAVEASADGFLVMLNSYWPYWRVCVNGVEKPLLPAYLAFSGTPITAGKHHVTLDYIPPYRLWPAKDCVKR